MVFLSDDMMADCVKQARKDKPAAAAALQFVIAHEIAHLYLSHEVRRAGLLREGLMPRGARCNHHVCLQSS